MESTINFNSFSTPAFPTNLKVMEFVHGSYQSDKFKRAISLRTKSYLKLFRLTNVEKYNTTAKDILEKANSIEFTAFNMHHARIKHPQTSTTN